MIQQRLGETPEEFEKRKRRVKLQSVPFGDMFAHAGGGSQVLANIIYNMDTFNVDGLLRLIDNAGSDSSSSDGEMHGSNHVHLNGVDQSIDYPIAHTLGSEEASGTINNVGSAVTKTTITNGYNLVWIADADYNNGRLQFDVTVSPTDINARYELVFDAVVNSGTLIFSTLHDGSISTRPLPNGDYTVTTGENRIVIIGRVGANNDILYPVINTTADVDIINISIKEITNLNSSIIYFDTATKGHITVDNSTGTPNTIYNQADSHSNTFGLTKTRTPTEVTSDKAYLDANPETVAKLVDGETVAGLSFVLADIHNFYPGNEGEASGTYVQDVTTALGSELVTNGELVADTDWTKGTGWTILGGVASCDGTQIADSLLTTLTVPVTVANSVYVVSFAVTAYTAGNVALKFDGVEVILDKTSIGTYVVLAKASDITGTIDIVADLNFVGSIDNVSLKLVAVAEIANFTTSCRTTLENTNYGASNLLYKQDATGRWLSMADANTIEFTGDSRYVDTGFMPPSDSAWEIDFVMETLADGTFKSTGILTAATANRCYISQSTSNGLYGYLGSKEIGLWGAVVSDGYHHIRIEFDGSGNGNFTIDNTTIYPYTASDYTYLESESFFIGALSSNGVINPSFLARAFRLPSGYFLYTNKERTVNERDADYAKAKANHPSLP